MVLKRKSIWKTAVQPVKQSEHSQIGLRSPEAEEMIACFIRLIGHIANEWLVKNFCSRMVQYFCKLAQNR